MAFEDAFERVFDLGLGLLPNWFVDVEQRARKIVWNLEGEGEGVVPRLQNVGTEIETGCFELNELLLRFPLHVIVLNFLLTVPVDSSSLSVPERAFFLAFHFQKDVAHLHRVQDPHVDGPLTELAWIVERLGGLNY